VEVHSWKFSRVDSTWRNDPEFSSWIAREIVVDLRDLFLRLMESWAGIHILSKIPGINVQ
jgi:hypothetical protein